LITLRILNNQGTLVDSVDYGLYLIALPEIGEEESYVDKLQAFVYIHLHSPDGAFFKFAYDDEMALQLNHNEEGTSIHTV